MKMTNLPQDLTNMINLFNENLNYRKLLNKVPLCNFVWLNQWKLPIKYELKHNVIVWLHHQSMVHGEFSLDFDSKIELKNLTLAYLYDVGNPIGYIFYIPKHQNLEVLETYFIAKRGKMYQLQTLEELPELLHEFSNNDLSVYFMEKAQIVVGACNNPVAVY